MSLNPLKLIFNKKGDDRTLKALPAPTNHANSKADKLRAIEAAQNVTFPIQSRYHNFCRTQEYKNPDLDEPDTSTWRIAREDALSHKWRIFEVTRAPNIEDPSKFIIKQKALHQGKLYEFAEMLWELHDFETCQISFERALSEHSPAPDEMGTEGIEYYHTLAYYEGIGFDINGDPLPADRDGRFNGEYRMDSDEQDNVLKYSQLIPDMPQRTAQDALDLQPSAFLKELFAQYAGQPTMLSTERMVDQLQDKFARVDEVEKQYSILDSERIKLTHVEKRFKEISGGLSFISCVLKQTEKADSTIKKPVVFDMHAHENLNIKAELYNPQSQDVTIIRDYGHHSDTGADSLYNKHGPSFVEDRELTRNTRDHRAHALIIYDEISFNDTISLNTPPTFERNKGHHNRHLFTPNSLSRREKYEAVLVNKAVNGEQLYVAAFYHKNFIGAGWVEQTANYLENALNQVLVKRYSSADLQTKLHEGLQSIRLFAAMQHAKLIYHADKIQANTHDHHAFQTNAFKEAMNIVEETLRPQIKPRDNFEIRMEALRQIIYSPEKLAIPDSIQEFLDYADTKMHSDIKAELDAYRVEINARKEEVQKLLNRENLTALPKPKEPEGSLSPF
jgi:hypothetical protein